MSRIGRKPIAVPSGVKIKQEPGTLQIEGPKGKLTIAIPEVISVKAQEQRLEVGCVNYEGNNKALHGLYRALINNMVTGVSTGFTKELEINGVGYRAALQGKTISFSVGFSHPVIVSIPDGLTVQVPKPTSVIISGSDRQLVGQFAADLRGIAPPEPYKGKGIKYAGEQIRRKAGKAATGAGAKAS